MTRTISDNEEMCNCGPLSLSNLITRPGIRCFLDLPEDRKPVGIPGKIDVGNPVYSHALKQSKDVLLRAFIDEPVGQVLKPNPVRMASPNIGEAQTAFRLEQGVEPRNKPAQALIIHIVEQAAGQNKVEWATA